MSLEATIAAYGPYAIFVGTALEGETVAITGGLLAHRELQPFWIFALAAILGAFCMDSFYFLLARRFRDHKHVRWLMQKPGFAQVHRWLDAQPGLFTVAYRFVPGMRTTGPLALGATTLPATRFLITVACTSTVWGILYTGIGHFLGQGLAAIFGPFKKFEHVLIVAGVLILAGIALTVLRRRRARALS